MRTQYIAYGFSAQSKYCLSVQANATASPSLVVRSLICMPQSFSLELSTLILGLRICGCQCNALIYYVTHVSIVVMIDIVDFL